MEVKEREVKVCDVCPEPKDAFSLDTKMANCYACNKDLCIEHTKKIGDMYFCPEHHRLIWKFIKDLRKKNYKAIQ